MFMEDKNSANPKGEIVIYRTKDKGIQLKVKFERETVWLSQLQMAELFDKSVPTINEHIKNIYQEGELRQKATIRKSRIVQFEAKRRVERLIDLYNLDVIISVGYRVKSFRGTQFRIWATKVLKDYLVKGYALNQKRLLEQTDKLKQIQSAINFINAKAAHPELIGRAQELLNIVSEYANALTLLYQYDKKTLAISKRKKPHFALTYNESKQFIEEAKVKLCKKGEATALFGQETGHKLESIIGALYQTFDRKELYPSVEEKSANLLYLIIKGHPFVDGNKRIGSLLFIYYLDRNNYLLKNNGDRKINDNTIVALALLIAASDPKEKEIMIKIITNLLKG